MSVHSCVLEIVGACAKNICSHHQQLDGESSSHSVLQVWRNEDAAGWRAFGEENSFSRDKPPVYSYEQHYVVTLCIFSSKTK